MLILEFKLNIICKVKKKNQSWKQRTQRLSDMGIM